MSTDKQRGLYGKFLVERADGSSAPGGKHEGCEYFVLDVTHDAHARAAVAAHAESCHAEYPLLAADLRARWMAPESRSAEVVDTLLTQQAEIQRLRKWIDDDNTIEQRDRAEAYIDKILDAVLGTAGVDREEWSSSYDFSDAVTDVEEKIAGWKRAEPVCTCPSGDGSLRWPCPMHPEVLAAQDGWPKLTAAARVNNGTFGTGISTLRVVEAAMRAYQSGGDCRDLTREQAREAERNRRALWDKLNGPLEGKPR